MYPRLRTPDLESRDRPSMRTRREAIGCAQNLIYVEAV